MSAEYLHHLESMIQHAQEFLYSMQRNVAPDMDAFDEIQIRNFERLKSFGPIDIRSPYFSQIKARLLYFESLNDEMVKVIKKLLSDSKSKLKSTSTRRRGITGYQKSLFGRNRGKGIWRGQG